MLELAADPLAIPPDRHDAFERNRNLFYVTCSRPKKRLGVLFTQRLCGAALQTVTTGSAPTPSKPFTFD